MNNIFIPLISGIAAGIILGFGFGTVFFAIIQNSIKHGFKRGLDIAFGVVISDLIIVSLILFGSQYLEEVEKYKNLIKYSGGILLIGLGIYQFFPQKPIIDQNGVVVGQSRFLYVSKGFLLNFMNPVNFIAWLSIQTYLKGVNAYTNEQSIIFFVAAIGAILFIEIMISALAHYIGKKLSERIIRIISFASGYIFIVLGIILIFKKI